MGLQNKITPVNEVSFSKDIIKKYPCFGAQLKIIFLFSFAPVTETDLFLLEKGIEIAKKCALHNKIEAFFGKKCGIFFTKKRPLL